MITVTIKYYFPVNKISFYLYNRNTEVNKRDFFNSSQEFLRSKNSFPIVLFFMHSFILLLAYEKTRRT